MHLLESNLAFIHNCFQPTFHTFFHILTYSLNITQILLLSFLYSLPSLSLDLHFHIPKLPQSFSHYHPNYLQFFFNFFKFNMTEVEGKLSIWIKDGKFSHASDLYVEVFIDDNNVSFFFQISYLSYPLLSFIRSIFILTFLFWFIVDLENWWKRWL